MKVEDIDFRVWHSKAKFFAHWNPKNFHKLWGISLEPLTFQQYTRKIDTRKKKIYEGDYVILEYDNFPEFIVMQDIYEVTAGKGGFMLTPRKFSKEGTMHFPRLKYLAGRDKEGEPVWKLNDPSAQPINNFNICRIIGNKFENPKLIK